MNLICDEPVMLRPKANSESTTQLTIAVISENDAAGAYTVCGRACVVLAENGLKMILMDRGIDVL
jgi:hypothetical protein